VGERVINDTNLSCNTWTEGSYISAADFGSFRIDLPPFGSYWPGKRKGHGTKKLKKGGRGDLVYSLTAFWGARESCG
jgi:hypothetical protein